MFDLVIGNKSTPLIWKKSFATLFEIPNPNLVGWMEGGRFASYFRLFAK
jgi:hypothetical protein